MRPNKKENEYYKNEILILELNLDTLAVIMPGH